jgi:hypothetical protein
MTNKLHAGGASPRNPRSAAAGRPKGLAGQVQLRAASADAVLAVVPHLLGFYPSRSLVVLGIGERNRVMITFRYDLPDLPDAEHDDDIAEHASYVLGRERLSSAMLIGYGPADLVVPVVAKVAARLTAAGVLLPEVLRAAEGRYWSLLCADPDCCPQEGVAYDPGSHPAAITLTQAGLTAHPDRDALVRTLQQPAGSITQARASTDAICARLAQVTRQAEAAGDPDPRLRVIRIGRTQVQRAIRRYQAGGEITDRTHLAALAVLLTDLRVRDDAWTRMDPAHCHDHCRLWTEVVRSATTDYVAAAASLLAFAAWQAGNGALAMVAVGRALAADPSYSLAQLLGNAIEAALPPWAARVPMTPAEVAACYTGSATDRPSADASAVSRAATRDGQRPSGRRGQVGDQDADPRAGARTRSGQAAKAGRDTREQAAKAGRDTGEQTAASNNASREAAGQRGQKGPGAAGRKADRIRPTGPSTGKDLAPRSRTAPSRPRRPAARFRR